MAKLKARGAITIASSTEQKNEKSQAITTVKKKVTTSYKVPPLTLRMSLKDKESIAGWVDDLQKLSERNVSAAKLFRALALYRDNIDDDELIKLIDKMN
ncbi:MULTISPECIES: hypothetical protein [Vibrio]|uniref:Uncharacterized protein n=1 Tax=Vibrio campbellii (strain ATCC BAA-1116) TaxID=2902295 RepID=A7N8U3_VIBC1|nr:MULTISPECIES: hypothetical protein [Vibrio]ABU75075.1 hypothetical protein VIBHAR_p08228 [Vibrio campbellii ATCC BAA-1116]AGU99080.1 hypothetical protein M892_28565 [Vibrio campbellii ATCC BAA-1116]EHR5466030.1 hypothetical protein [Vibrio parahaemolyticus]MBT0123776.1 hypothetical protein [Vibrio campbellii]MBT0138728.1 hypothetical protein [Vibrio campbellii]